MTLLIDNDDVRAVLTMDVTMRALNEAYTRLAAGEAVCRPRIDIRIPTDDAHKTYRWGSVVKQELQSTLDRRTARTGRTHSCTRPTCITVKTSLAKPGPSTHSHKRKFVVFDRRCFVSANSRPIPACALTNNFPEPVSSDSFNHDLIRPIIPTLRNQTASSSDRKHSER